MPRPEKVEAVKDIAGRFDDAEAALLTEYRGLKVAEIAELRGALRQANAEYKVLKNTLTRLAVREVGLDELVEMLEGPTAIVFCKGDPAAAAKALDEAVKKYPVIVVKGGVLKGKVIGPEQAKELARLESREMLLTKIAMMLNSPLQQMVNVLAAPLRDLGSMLAQVLAKKEPVELPEDGGKVDAPQAEAPEAEAPEAEAPEAEAPEAEAPEAEAPEAEAPEAEAPEAEAPEAEAPEAEAPEAEAPEAEAEETPSPDEAPGAPEEVPGEPTESDPPADEPSETPPPSDPSEQEAAPGGDDKEA